MTAKYFLQRIVSKAILDFIRYVCFVLITACHDFISVKNVNIFSFQSDIVHQSVYELVHSEDREELQRQLMWNAFCPGELSGIPLQEIVHTPEHCHFLERSFTVRFRCLLDNTSGFLVSARVIFIIGFCSVFKNSMDTTEFHKNLYLVGYNSKIKGFVVSHFICPNLVDGQLNKTLKFCRARCFWQNKREYY